LISGQSEGDCVLATALPNSKRPSVAARARATVREPRGGDKPARISRR